jgi:hypothetical protein
MEQYAERPFVKALVELMVERGYETNAFGFPYLTHLAERVKENWGYEHIRKMVSGERSLQPAFIEDVARVLLVEPTYFREYRIAQVCDAVEHHPELVEQVYESILALADALDEKKGLDQQAKKRRFLSKRSPQRRRSAFSREVQENDGAAQ